MSHHVFLAATLALVFLVLVPHCFCTEIETAREQLDQDSHDWQVIPPEKRSSWQNFQGSWGKRDSDDLTEEKRNWKNFQGSWGKRDYADAQNEAEEMAKRAAGWSKLHGTWGKRYYGKYDNDYTRSLLDANTDQPSGADEEIAVPYKREWSKFAGSWGKRPFSYRVMSPRSTNWSSLRGSWGKRGGNWSQLRGVWGKKSSDV